MRVVKIASFVLSTLFASAGNLYAEQSQQDNDRIFTRGTSQGMRGGTTVGPAVTYDDSTPES